MNGFREAIKTPISSTKHTQYEALLQDTIRLKVPQVVDHENNKYW